MFLGFGYKVDVRCNFRSQQTQAGMQVSSAILIRIVAFQSHHNWESTFPYFEQGEHIFSENSLKRGNCPFAPLVVGLVTLQLFQNCFPRISVVFAVCFLVKKNSFGTDIACNFKRHCGLPLLCRKNTFPPNKNWIFCFPPTLLSWHSLIVKLLYLKKYYFITSTIHI